MSQLTNHQAKYFAFELQRSYANDHVGKLAGLLFDAQVEPKPHQIDAALFALQTPYLPGVILADEVGLGKTIEAGIVLTQYWAERKRNILIIAQIKQRGSDLLIRVRNAARSQLASSVGPRDLRRGPPPPKPLEREEPRRQRGFPHCR